MTSASPSRAMSILEFVGRQTKPATFDQVVDALLSCAPAPKDVRRFRVVVAAQLQQLTKVKKLKRAGKPREYTYTTTPTTFADGRATGKPAKATSPAKATTPTPVPTTKSEPVRIVNRPPAPSAHMRATLSTMFGHGQYLKKPGDLTSHQLAHDLAEFTAQGGRIERIAPGVSSESLRIEAELKSKGLKAIHEATWRRKQGVKADETDLETEEA